MASVPKYKAAAAKKGSFFSSKVTITRPANQTQYSANDIVGGALELQNVGPDGGVINLTDVSLRLDIASLPTTAGMTGFRLHLYDATPPSALADNAAHDIPVGDRANYLGYVDLGTPIDMGATLFVQATPAKTVKLADGATSLFVYLTTVTSYTPAANSEVYTLGVGGKC